MLRRAATAAAFVLLAAFAPSVVRAQSARELAVERDRLYQQAKDMERERKSIAGESGAGCLAARNREACDRLSPEKIRAIRDQADALNHRIARMNQQNFPSGPATPPDSKPATGDGGVCQAVRVKCAAEEGFGKTNDPVARAGYAVCVSERGCSTRAENDGRGLGHNGSRTSDTRGGVDVIERRTHGGGAAGAGVRR